MKVKILKMVSADGKFRKAGEVIEANDELADQLIRTGVAEKSTEAPKKSKK